MDSNVVSTRASIRAALFVPTPLLHAAIPIKANSPIAKLLLLDKIM
jgi:hypothetical protein